MAPAGASGAKTRGTAGRAQPPAASRPVPDAQPEADAGLAAAVPLRADGTPDPTAAPVPVRTSRRSTERARARAAAAPADRTRRPGRAEPTGPFGRITRHPAYRHVSAMFPIFIVLALLATGYWGYQTITAPKPSPTPVPTPTPIALAELASRFETLSSARTTAMNASVKQVSDAGTDVTKLHAAYKAWHDGDSAYADAISAVNWQEAETQASSLAAALQYEVGLLEKLETAEGTTLDSLKQQLDPATKQVSQAEDAMRQVFNPQPSASPGASESAGASGSTSAEPSGSGSPSAGTSAPASPSAAPSASASAS